MLRSASTRTPKVLLLLCLLLCAALLILAAGCGGDDQAVEDTRATTPDADGDAVDTSPDSESDPDSASDTDSAPGTAGDGDAANETVSPVLTPGGLTACPNPLVIQTDWFPEPEHGAVYNLTAGEGSIDPASGRFSGPLAADPSITIEVRSGGPFIDFQPTTTLMATDEDIFLGLVNTDEAISVFNEIQTTSVMAPLEINPQIIMWDPETYDIESWDDVAGTNAVINHFAGAAYAEWLVGSGLVDKANLDGSYDGGPSRFITEGGALIQQGSASQEPWNYENLLDEWGRPVDYLLVHDSGFPIYQGALAILNSRLTDDVRSCLEEFIPLVQQSAVDFQNDPAATSGALLQAVSDLDSSWLLNEAGVANSVKVMTDLGLVGNGPDSTLGNFDLDRVNEIITVIDENVPSIDVLEGLTAENLVTNEFLDPSIGF